MATGTGLTIPQQYRNAYTLIGKLYSRKNMPPTIENSRAAFGTVNADFTAHGREWLAMLTPQTKAIGKTGGKGTSKKGAGKRPIAKKQHA